LYPIPYPIWSTLSLNQNKFIREVSNKTDSQKINVTFRNHNVGPSTISLVWTGITIISKDRFEEELSQLFKTDVKENRFEDTSNLSTKLYFNNTNCDLFANRNNDFVTTDTNDNNLRPTEYHLKQPNGKDLTISFYPIFPDELKCNGEILKGNLVTMSFETLKRYPF
jgi:hypothetical protein